MKINTENLSFQKKLVAKCKIGNAGKTHSASIYELDKKEDIMELHKAYLSSLWDDNFYLEEYTDEFEDEGYERSFRSYQPTRSSSGIVFADEDEQYEEETAHGKGAAKKEKA